MRGSGGVISAATGRATTPGAGDAPRRRVSSVAAIRGVLRVTPFRRLWYSTALSSLGDWLGLLATTALATALAHGYQAQSYALGGVLVVKLLPAIVLGPLAGAFADRFDRRRTMVVSDAAPLRAVPDHPDRRRHASTLAAHRELPDRVRQPVLDAGQGCVGPQPGAPRSGRGGQPAQPDHHLRHHPDPRRGAVLGAVADHERARPGISASSGRSRSTSRSTSTRRPSCSARWSCTSSRRSAGAAARASSRTSPGLFALLREGAAFVRSRRSVGGIIIGLVGAFVAGGAVIGAGKIFVVSLGGGNASYGVLFGAVFVGLGGGMAFGPRIARGSLEAAAVRAVDRLRRGLPHAHGAHAVRRAGDHLRGRHRLRRRHRLPVGHDPDRHRRRRRDPRARLRPAAVADPGRAHPRAGGGAVRRRAGRPATPHDRRRGTATIDGTRFVLFAGGLFAMAAGILAFRKMDDRQQMSVWIGLQDVAARRLGGTPPDAQRRRLRRVRGRRGLRQVDPDPIAGRRRCASVGRGITVTHEPGATIGRAADPRTRCCTTRNR